MKKVPTQKAIDQLNFILEQIDSKNPEAEALLKEWKELPDPKEGLRTLFQK